MKHQRRTKQWYSNPMTHNQPTPSESLSAEQLLRMKSNDLELAQSQIAGLTDRLDLVTSKLQAARRKLDVANRIRSNFLSAVSHELRTPLTSIMGFADELAEPGPIDPAFRDEAIDAIRRNGRQLLDLICDYLELARMSGETASPETNSLSSVWSLAEETAAVLRATVFSGRVYLTIQAMTALPDLLNFDSNRLKHVLLHLLRAAIKCSERGTVQLAIGIERDASVLRFDITATGEVLSPAEGEFLRQHQSSAEDALNQGNLSGKFLGLLLCKRSLELMGSELLLADSTNRSHLILRVGAAGFDKAKFTRPAPIHVARSDQPLETAQDRHLILVAEDCPDTQRLIEVILKHAGYSVVTVGTGQEALDFVRHRFNDGTTPIPQVIITDMQMPVMDGYTATRRLRECGFSGPIIALTAFALSDDRRTCLAAGCDDYLAKPVDRHQLLTTIQEWIAIKAGTTTSSATPAR